MNELCCSQTVKDYSALKRNELSSYEKTLGSLKCASQVTRGHQKRLCIV